VSGAVENVNELTFSTQMLYDRVGESTGADQGQLASRILIVECLNFQSNEYGDSHTNSAIWNDLYEGHDPKR
jgi:hypothetical protein